MIPATSLVVLLSAILTVLGDVQRPTQGYQIGHGPGTGVDIIFPLTMAQCEPVLIYYNTTHLDYVLWLTPDGYDILDLYFPTGVGYLDWICDIPAGYSFVVHGFGQWQYYIVQPGSSSDCLSDITTTYSYASYYTKNSEFQSYTQNSPSGDPDWSTLYQQPIIDFPTSSLPIITANPNLAVTATTTHALSSTSSSLLTSSTPVSSIFFPSPVASTPVSPHKSKKAAIAGGIIGGAAFILLALALLFMFLRKRSKLHSKVTAESLTFESEPKAYSGLMTSQPGLAYMSAPALPSSDSIHTVHRESEFTPKMAEAGVVAKNHVPFATLPGALTSHLSDTAGNISSRNPGSGLALALDATRGLTANERQALIASLIASTDLAAPEASSQPALPELSTSTATQEGFPDITNILGVISRAQLSARERHTLVASLNTLLAPDQATPDALASVMSSPPPYAG